MIMNDVSTSGNSLFACRDILLENVANRVKVTGMNRL